MKQTEAQRAADDLDSERESREAAYGFDYPHLQQAADLLRRQDELLLKALCVLERVHHTTDADRAAAADAIRSHLEAK